MTKIINAYWYKSHNPEHISNWGDAINPWLINKISNREVIKTDAKPRLLAIGSIIHLSGLRDGDIIWGPGTLYQTKVKDNLNLDIRAVRGPLTRDVLIKSGYEILHF